MNYFYFYKNKYIVQDIYMYVYGPLGTSLSKSATIRMYKFI